MDFIKVTKGYKQTHELLRLIKVFVEISGMKSFTLVTLLKTFLDKRETKQFGNVNRKTSGKAFDQTYRSLTLYFLFTSSFDGMKNDIKK